MKELILSVLSLIILLPIIIFLPLGLSNKGKGVIVIASFLLANIGFLTQEVLSPWLLWLVLALLVFLISYVIQGRFADVLFAGTPTREQSNDSVSVNDQKNFMDSQKASSPVKDEKEDSHIAHIAEYDEEQESSKYEEELLVYSDEKQHPSEDGDDTVTSEQSDQEYEVSEITENKDRFISDEGEEDELSALIEQMDTSFLNEREKEWTGIAETKEVPKEERKVDDSEESAYMAEIEKLIEAEDEELLFDDKNEESLEEREEEITDAHLALEEIPIDDLDVPELSTDYSAQSPSQEVSEDLSGQLFGATNEFTSEIDEVDEQMQTEMLHKEEEIAKFSSHLAPADEDREWLDELKDEEKDLEDEKWQLTEEEHEYPIGIKTEEEYSEDVSTQFGLDNEEKPKRDMIDDQDEFFDAEKESQEEDERSFEVEPEELADVEGELNVETNPDYSTDGLLEEDKDVVGHVNKPGAGLVFVEDDHAEAPFEDAFAEAALSTSSHSDDDMLQTMDESETEEQNGAEDTKGFQQQMFSLMASQLQIESKRLPVEDYEMLIRDHMVHNLSPHDYYTFASMLIEHYIRNKEMGKLHDLLCDLREKFAKYPILTMEIQYLYEQYCENTL